MKYALIIGNDRYTDPKLARLKAPVADVRALGTVLSDQSIGFFDKVIPLINKTESQVSRAISNFFTDKKPEDLVLVYFSGHGVLDGRGRLFLALKDTQTSLLKSTAIPAAFISEEMDSCRSRRQILILDCCNSGAFERGAKGEQKAVTEATFEGNGFGRVVLTASDSTQFALEGEQIIQTELSLFTHFLLAGLRTGEADLDNDGYVSLDEWYDYTYTQVLATTPKQNPNKWSYRQQGDLIIAKNPSWKKKVAGLPTKLSDLLESPYLGAREAAARELGVLLRSGDSHLAELARQALEKLKEDNSLTVSLAAENMLLEVGLAKETREKEEREAAEKTAREQTEREKAEKTAEEKLQRKADEKARKEKAEQEAAEKVEQENAKRQTAEKAKRERAKRQTAQVAALREAFSRFSNSLKVVIPKAKPLLRIGGILGIVFVLIWIGSWAMPQFLSSAPTATASITQGAVTTIVVTNSPLPITRNVEPQATSTKTATPVPTSLPTEITDAKGVQMMLIPSGEFTMGTGATANSDEQPAHQVYLDAFYMDNYEVTNALYRACVDAGHCNPPQNTSFNNSFSYYGNSQYDNYPVIYVDWNQAKAYCEWRGGSLPTEAQWEKAARGSDERIYPWGNDFDDSGVNFCDKNCSAPWAAHNLDDGYVGTAPVGSYESGKSPYGIYDLAGNVWEWVADWYSDTYYQNSPAANPLGPDSGQYRVRRGASWGNVYLGGNVRSVKRDDLTPNSIDSNLGFRCARSS